eukprot:m51a1_g5382 putative alpha-amylase (754) ;mRNA; f:10030-12529
MPRSCRSVGVATGLRLAVAVVALGGAVACLAADSRVSLVTEPPSLKPVFNVSFAKGFDVLIVACTRGAPEAETSGATMKECGGAWGRSGSADKWDGSWKDNTQGDAVYAGERRVDDLNTTCDVWRMHVQVKRPGYWSFWTSCTARNGDQYWSSLGGNGMFEVPEPAGYNYTEPPICGDTKLQAGEECDVGGQGLHCTEQCKCESGTVPFKNLRGCRKPDAHLPSGPTDLAGRELWRNRTIYQVLVDRFAPTDPATMKTRCPNLNSYCNGTFEGIRKNLDYILELGFDAIWISPVVENTPDGYHGYWAKNLSGINPYWGTPEELKGLIKAAHGRGMLVMIDIVLNHLGQSFYPESIFWPFNEPSHYHDCSGCPRGCDIGNMDNQTELELCRLLGLRDLNQSVAYVRDELVAYVQRLATEYGADGFRVDTVRHIPVEFWEYLRPRVPLFMTGEVWSEDDAYLSAYQGPLDSLLWYSMYGAIHAVFRQGQDPTTIDRVLRSSHRAFYDVSVLCTFAENHDNDRFLFVNPDRTLYRNALAAVMLGEGIPIMYYGAEQEMVGGHTDPERREPLWYYGLNRTSENYKYISATMRARRQAGAWKYPQASVVAEGSVYAFVRGGLLAVLRNSGNASAASTVAIPPSKNLLPGTYTAITGYEAQRSIVVVAGVPTVVALPAGGEPMVFLLETASPLPTSSSRGSIPAAESSKASVPAAESSKASVPAVQSSGHAGEKGAAASWDTSAASVLCALAVAVAMEL